MQATQSTQKKSDEEKGKEFLMKMIFLPNEITRDMVALPYIRCSVPDWAAVLKRDSSLNMGTLLNTENFN